MQYFVYFKSVRSIVNQRKKNNNTFYCCKFILQSFKLSLRALIYIYITVTIFSLPIDLKNHWTLSGKSATVRHSNQAFFGLILFIFFVFACLLFFFCALFLHINFNKVRTKNGIFKFHWSFFAIKNTSIKLSCGSFNKVYIYTYSSMWPYHVTEDANFALDWGMFFS